MEDVLAKQEKLEAVVRKWIEVMDADEN